MDVDCNTAYRVCLPREVTAESKVAHGIASTAVQSRSRQYTELKFVRSTLRPLCLNKNLPISID